MGFVVSTNGAAGDVPRTDDDADGDSNEHAASSDSSNAPRAMDVDVEEEKEEERTPASSTSSPSAYSRRHPSSHLDSTIAGLQRYVDSEFEKIDNGATMSVSRAAVCRHANKGLL